MSATTRPARRRREEWKFFSPRQARGGLGLGVHDEARGERRGYTLEYVYRTQEKKRKERGLRAWEDGRGLVYHL